MSRELMTKPGQNGILAKLDDIVAGFFRRQGDVDGKVYFGSKRGERGPTYYFPVFSDGTVSRSSSGIIINPMEEVVVISPEDLGIDKLVWV